MPIISKFISRDLIIGPDSHIHRVLIRTRPRSILNRNAVASKPFSRPSSFLALGRPSQHLKPVTTDPDCPNRSNQSTYPYNDLGKYDHGRQVRGKQYFNIINCSNKKDNSERDHNGQNSNNLSESPVKGGYLSDSIYYSA